MVDVLCFGNLQCDVLCRTVDAWPVPGELRMVGGIDVALSGNGGNVASALARLGVPVELAGYSGADAVGEGFRATLSALGVGLDKLGRHSTASTGISCIAVAPSGERSIVFVNGANALFDLDAVPDTWFAGVRVVSLSAVFLLPQFTGEAIARLFARAHACGAVTLLKTAWDADGRGLRFLGPALALVDYLIANRDEGRQLTGLMTGEAIVGALGAHTGGVIIVTLGADGCLIRAETGELQYVPAVDVVAVDSTGAGDAFVAGFIAGLHEGRSTLACARLGCRVAAYAVTGPGAYPRIPLLRDIEGVGVAIVASDTLVPNGEPG